MSEFLITPIGLSTYLVLPHSYKGSDFHPQSYWSLADISSCIRIIIVKAVVVQFPLNILILTLILKRNEGGIIVSFPLSAEGVKFLLSSLFVIVIKCLQGSIEVVGNEDENLSVGYNLDRYMRKSPTLIAMSPVILF